MRTGETVAPVSPARLIICARPAPGNGETSDAPVSGYLTQLSQTDPAAGVMRNDAGLMALSQMARSSISS